MDERRCLAAVLLPATIEPVHAFEPAPVPLTQGDDGVIRIQGTRVTLEVIVSAFEAGATAEEIAHQYPTIGLEAAYAVIAWVLRHRAEVRDYVARREAEADRVQADMERRYPAEGIRERLLARVRR
jgi:uncharacterized protein (DUF433 family)